jgi:formylglycine-generating enzyme required for sulfatase activity
MKTLINSWMTGLTFSVGINLVAGQMPVISSFSQNGVLVCSNLLPGSVASVQWASSLSGSWSNWTGAVGLDALTVNSNGTIMVSLPVFYRVLGVAATNATPAGMALIPAGTFTMGDTLDGEGDAIPANVYVSGLYMDTNLVSFSLWQSVYNWAITNGYVYTNEYGYQDTGAGKAANHPVVSVDWFDSVKWSNARSQQAGLTPVYYTDAGLTQVFTNGDSGTTVYANWGANGYRLPTEAEWEKAARGGLVGLRFPWGNTISESQANYSAYPIPPNPDGFAFDLGPYSGCNTNFDSLPYPYTSPVGYFAPNGYGLNDMAGNVYEWCWDWYSAPPYLTGSPYLGGTDPRGPIGPLGYRVTRGGSWSADKYSPYYARCAFRGTVFPNYSADADIGFRCVRGL